MEISLYHAVKMNSAQSVELHELTVHILTVEQEH